MKNFEMNCPVEGTSALQPKLDSAPARRARIIAFPQHAVLPDRDVRAVRDGASIVSAVRTGSAQGVAFGRVQRWSRPIKGGDQEGRQRFWHLIALSTQRIIGFREGCLRRLQLGR